MPNVKGNFYMNRKLFSLSIFLFFLAGAVFAESEGEKLFKNDKPAEAIVFLEDEIKNGTASPSAYNYLGLAYFQTGEFEKSIDAFDRGMKASGTNKKILSFNQGNTYYIMGKFEEAARSFTLVLSADPKFTSALLNRGNAYLMAKKYAETIEDYERFIIMEPEDSQRPQIEEILALLRQELVRQAEEAKFKAEEEARIAEEELRMAEEMERQKQELAKQREEEERLAELQRQEEERVAAIKRAEEAERRRKLLEDVANSLQNTGSTNMTSGSEDIINYEYESELD